MGSWSNYDNNVSDHRPIGLKLSLNNLSYIPEIINKKKKVIKILDVLGRETNEKVNTPLFYIYNDGTIVKKIIIE